MGTGVNLPKYDLLLLSAYLTSWLNLNNILNHHNGKVSAGELWGMSHTSSNTNWLPQNSKTIFASTISVVDIADWPMMNYQEPLYSNFTPSARGKIRIERPSPCVNLIFKKKVGVHSFIISCVNKMAERSCQTYYRTVVNNRQLLLDMK
jgi:hypothetical protein